MKKILMSTAVAAMLLATSCQNEEIISQQESNLFRLEVQKGGSSRTAIASDGSVTWSKGDKLFVYGENGTYGTLMLDDEDAGCENGTFTGFVYGNIKDLKYVAYGNGVKKVGDDVKVTLGDITLPNSNAPMFAALNPNNLNSVTLQHVCGVVRMNIVGLLEGDIVSVVGKGIAGSATFNEATAALVADNTTAEQTIKVTGAKDSYHIDVPLLADGEVDKVYVNDVVCDITNFKVTAKKLDASSIPTLNMINGTPEVTAPAVSKIDDIKTAAAVNGAVVTIAAGEYTFPSASIAKEVTIICEEGTIFSGVSSLNVNGATVVGAIFSNPSGAAVTGNKATEKYIKGYFKNCTFTGKQGISNCIIPRSQDVTFEDCVFEAKEKGNTVHFDEINGNVSFDKCVFSGSASLGGGLGSVTIEGCVFQSNENSTFNSLAIWGVNTTIVDCDFVFDGSAPNEYVRFESDKVTYQIDNCKINGISYTSDNFQQFEKYVFGKKQITVSINGKPCSIPVK